MSSFAGRLGKIAANVVVLVISLAIMGLLLEAFVRIAGLQPMHRNPDLHQASDVDGLIFELIPNNQTRGYNKETVTTNDLGFRSPALDPSKKNIVVLGDSMTFGLGVEDNEANPAVLQEHFPEYNVVNMGVSSYNIEQETRNYLHHANALQPSLVILEFVINDADPKAQLVGDVFTTDDAKLKQQITGEGTWKIPGKVFLHKNSALFTFIERRTKGMSFRAKSSVLSTEWTPDQLAYWKTWFDQLNNAVGVRPKLFVRWPDNWLHPETVLAIDRYAQDRGWTVLDLGDLFGTTYPNLGWDQHPNADGQRQAADAMAALIERENLLDATLRTGTGSVR